MNCPSCGFNADRKTVALGQWKLTTELASGNVVRSNSGGNSGYSYRKHRSRYQRAVNLHPAPELHVGGKRRLTITRLWGKGKRALDRDNLIIGCKPLIDVIVRAGWVFDDKPKYLEVVYKQVKNPNGLNEIEIKLEQLV